MVSKHHDCTEVIEKVELLLDGELNAKDEQDVLCELQRCMHCLNEYNLEKRFKTFIQERVSKKCMPSPCLSKIKESLSKEN